jgi:hypothetical protein
MGKRTGTTRRSRATSLRCGYCGKDMKLDIRVGETLCCKACEDYMREKRILDIVMEKEKE